MRYILSYHFLRTAKADFPNLDLPRTSLLPTYNVIMS